TDCRRSLSVEPVVVAELGESRLVRWGVVMRGGGKPDKHLLGEDGTPVSVDEVALAQFGPGDAVGAAIATEDFSSPLQAQPGARPGVDKAGPGEATQPAIIPLTDSLASSEFVSANAELGANGYLDCLAFLGQRFASHDSGFTGSKREAIDSDNLVEVTNDLREDKTAGVEGARQVTAAANDIDVFVLDEFGRGTQVQRVVGTDDDRQGEQVGRERGRCDRQRVSRSEFRDQRDAKCRIVMGLVIRTFGDHEQFVIVGPGYGHAVAVPLNPGRFAQGGGAGGFSSEQHAVILANRRVRGVGSDVEHGGIRIDIETEVHGAGGGAAGGRRTGAAAGPFEVEPVRAGIIRHGGQYKA